VHGGKVLFVNGPDEGAPLLADFAGFEVPGDD